MNYWLVKSEPNQWSWQNHKKVKVEPWDGVRNYQASNYLKKMRQGDLSFFYHSGKERCIVGILEVVKEHYPDYTDNSGVFVMVDFLAKAEGTKPLSLAAIKNNDRLNHLVLVKQSRLSVMPIDEKAWHIIYEELDVKAL